MSILGLRSRTIRFEVLGKEKEYQTIEVVRLVLYLLQLQQICDTGMSTVVLTSFFPDAHEKRRTIS